MPQHDDQIATLQERLTQLKARQQRLEARKRAVETQRERKADTRRKILLGGVLLAKVRARGIPVDQLHAWLDPALTRADDRALFNLPTPATQKS